MFAITLRFLLAVDLWLSKKLGVCACEESPWGGIRPLVRLVEFSGHVVPWLVGAVYTLLRGGSVAEQELMLNLTLGEESVWSGKVLVYVWVGIIPTNFSISKQII